MPHRRLAQAIARMKAQGPSPTPPDPLEEATSEMQDLSVCDRSDTARADDVEEEEEYVKTMLARSLDIFHKVQSDPTYAQEGYSLLVKELALEFEYTSWPVLSDETLNTLTTYLLDLIHTVEKEFVVEEVAEEEASIGKLREGAPGAALDCAFAAVDVLEGMMEARFIKYIGEDLEGPFDKDGSLNIYRALVSALRLIVSVINYEGYHPAGTDDTNTSTKRAPSPSPDSESTAAAATILRTGSHPCLSSPRNCLAPKSFTFDDDAGEEQTHTKSKTYEPLQYLLTVLYLLSHTSIQTEVTCFWWCSDTVIDELWARRNFKALIASIDIVMDKLQTSTDDKDIALLTILVDRWVHTLHGLICTDSIGRQMSSTVPEEDKAKDEIEKPGIECLTGVSTYLGRWMDVRCLPCSCQFCSVQRASMECMMSKWDKRLAHRLIELEGVKTIGRVSFWLLENFRNIEVSGDITGEDLYRTDVALTTQIVHLCVLSDYEVATLAEEHTLRARAVKQAIDSGFLNFLLAYFIPRKLCRLEDRQCETTEDQNRARRLARISCKNCIEFLLLSGDGWITDTCYNARGMVKIDSGINNKLAPAAQRLLDLWAEDKRVCATEEELLEHYSPFFLKLCEIIRLSARYGWMKDQWSQELLDNCVNVLSTYTHLKIEHQHTPTQEEGLLPAKKALLCAMAAFCDMCSPFFGGRDHYTAASRAVHDCKVLKLVLEKAKSTKAAGTPSCMRALSYVSRVELVMSVSTKSQHRPEHHHTAICNQCHRPPTLERPLRQCGRCKKVYYCCVDCQRANWKDHEKSCLPIEVGAGGGEGNKRVKRGLAVGRNHNSGNSLSSEASGGSSSTGASAGGGSTHRGYGAGGGASVHTHSHPASCSQCEAKAQGDRPLMTCGRCREVFYCSKECQTKHWTLHRSQCGPDPLLEAQQNMGGGKAVTSSP